MFQIRQRNFNNFGAKFFVAFNCIFNSFLDIFRQSFRHQFFYNTDSQSFNVVIKICRIVFYGKV